MIRRFTRAALSGAAVAMLVAGCAVATSQHDTSLQLSIEDAPVGASCVRLKVEGPSEEWRLFDIRDGVAPSFGLTGIQPGPATVTVTGFDAACRDVTPFLAPVWTSDPVHVDVGRLPNQQLRMSLHQAAFLSAIATRAGTLIRFIERAGASTPDGGTSVGADAGTTSPPGTVCQGAACVTVGEPPDGGVAMTGEGGVGASGEGGVAFRRFGAWAPYSCVSSPSSTAGRHRARSSARTAFVWCQGRLARPKAEPIGTPARRPSQRVFASARCAPCSSTGAPPMRASPGLAPTAAQRAPLRGARYAQMGSAFSPLGMMVTRASPGEARFCLSRSAAPTPASFSSPTTGPTGASPSRRAALPTQPPRRHACLRPRSASGRRACR